MRTRQGDFTGFLQWDREEAVGRDKLVGRTADGDVSLRFDGIRSIARHPAGGSQVTLLDGREIVLSGTRKVGPGNRGIYVDDPRYGRVLVSWDAFERVDFSPGGSSPSYTDFPPGRPLTGSVTTRAGRRLDRPRWSTTSTRARPPRHSMPPPLAWTTPSPSAWSPRSGSPLGDARTAGRARVTLQSGEALQLDRAGDLGDGNAGILIFADGRERPEYVPWADIKQIDFDRPAAMYPPHCGR